MRDDIRINTAMINALYNSNRPKNKPFKELWKKRDETVEVSDLKIGYMEVLDMEANDPRRSWVEKIYAANNKKAPNGIRR